MALNHAGIKCKRSIPLFDLVNELGPCCPDPLTRTHSGKHFDDPRFIWRTTEVTIKPLSQVDDAFAWDEGEGDRTRNWWLAAHRRYFGRQASREGCEFDDDVLTVFERFEVVCPFDVADMITGPKSDG